MNSSLSFISTKRYKQHGYLTYPPRLRGGGCVLSPHCPCSALISPPYFCGCCRHRVSATSYISPCSGCRLMIRGMSSVTLQGPPTHIPSKMQTYRSSSHTLSALPGQSPQPLSSAHSSLPPFLLNKALLRCSTYSNPFPYYQA